MIFQVGRPIAYDDSTYSWSRMVITCARTIRPKELAQEKASAMIRLTVLVPSTETITTAVMILGMPYSGLLPRP